jgi:hypothetical protein
MGGMALEWLLSSPLADFMLAFLGVELAVAGAVVAAVTFYRHSPKRPPAR